MSPLRGIIALAVVTVAAGAIYLMQGGSQTPPGPAELDNAQLTVGAEDAAGNAAPAPERPSASTALSDPTRAEAKQESSAPVAETGTIAKFAITGTVLDEQGRPVGNTKVQLINQLDHGLIPVPSDQFTISNRQSTGTGADGRFRFDAVVASGQFTLRAVPQALMAAELKLTQHRTGDLDVGVLTAALGAELVGHVVSDAGQPVPGAEVRAWTRQGNSGSSPGLIVFGDVGARNAREAVTDDSGFFRIRGLEPGSVTALAKAEGFTQESVRDIVIRKGARSEDVTIKVSEGSAITGVVLDESGRPLAGAKVGVMETVIDLNEGGVVGELGQNLTTRSGQDGSFRLSGLKNSTYNVSVSKAGYLRDIRRDVEAGVHDLRLALGKSGVLYGYVNNRITGLPIRDFEIRIRAEQIFFPGSHLLPGESIPVARGAEAAALAGVAEAPGLYAVAELPSKSVLLIVEADGFAEYRYGPIRVEGPGTIQQDADLVPEITLSGLVVDSQGQPAPSASVNLTEAQDAEAELGGGAFVQHRLEISSEGGQPRVIDGDSRYSDTSDENGRFTLKGIAPGKYRLLASHEEWAQSEQLSLDLGEGDQLEDLVVALRAGGAVTGLTYDADGNLLEQATVTLNKAPDPQAGRAGGLRRMSMGLGGGLPGQGLKQTESDERGVFHLGGILPGRYVLELKNPNKTGGGAMTFMMMNFGAEAKGTPVSIEAGETAKIDLYLPPTGTVTGRVTEAGNPLAGVRVTLQDQQSPFPQLAMGGPNTRTDDNGHFELQNVEPGDYTLTVAPPDAAQPVTRDLEVRARETANENVNLPTGVVAGRVTNSGDGRPIEGVIVRVDPSGAESEQPKPRARVAMMIMTSESSSGGGVTTMRLGNEPDAVTTDENGYYTVRFVAPGDYTVSVSGAGIEKMEQDRVRVFEGQRSDGIDFKAVLGATLIVRPAPDTPEPIHFFRATLTNQATGEEEQHTEAGKPTMRIDGLAAGTYLLKITANNKSGEKVIEIGSGEEQEVRVPIR